ncbi:MAG: homocysteine S-methyltransferase [Alphaproteobacteria bacterium]|nr:homocysteine S-methyltransferase [Alphaproteobacteria bacterium]
MPRYRSALPQLAGTPFLTDSGLETTLVFEDAMDLPCFASFPLLETEAGRARLRRYYQQHIEIARANGAGFVLEAPTWRASADWGAKLGYDAAALDRVNRDAIDFLRALRDDPANAGVPMVISANVGPQGDAYSPATQLSADAAERYHTPQMRIFAETEADMVAAFTLTYVEEAIGIARAAKKAGLPCAISFTTETDGRLPSGQLLGEAIVQVDEETNAAPAYFMVNCAHPVHFAHAIDRKAPWAQRIAGLRANASTKSHAELDEATALDPGDPADLGARYRVLLEALPRLAVLGGCCGTDHRHVEAIAAACLDHGRLTRAA